MANDYNGEKNHITAPTCAPAGSWLKEGEKRQMGEAGRVRKGAGKRSLGQTGEESPPAAVGSAQV